MLYATGQPDSRLSQRQLPTNHDYTVSPPNIRPINRRSKLPRLLLALSLNNNKTTPTANNIPADSQRLTGSLIAVDRITHIRGDTIAVKVVGWQLHLLLICRPLLCKNSRHKPLTAVSQYRFFKGAIHEKR